MAKYAGEVAVEKGVGRQEQDEWALRSHWRWGIAQSKGKFNEELIPLEIPSSKGDRHVLNQDEHPRPETTMEKLSRLQPVYGSPTVTAGNASGIADGATATILMKGSEARRRGILPLGRIVAYAPICGEPRESPVLPAVAIHRALSQTRLTLDDMKLIEINEAFASMPLVSSLVLVDYDRKGRRRSGEIECQWRGDCDQPHWSHRHRLLMNMLYELRRQGGVWDGIDLWSHRPGLTVIVEV
jgi:acetyl-CoA C-acetyltransferase